MGRRTGDYGGGQRASLDAAALHSPIINHVAPDSDPGHPSSIINPCGFTLIELLVVIAVIALLMAILLPAVQSVRRKAKALVCQSNLRQWGPILNQYLDDNEGRFPYGGAAGAWLLRGGAPSSDPNRSIVPYSVRTERIALCPMAVKPGGHQYNEIVHLQSSPYEWDNVWEAHITYGSAFETWEIRQPEPRFRGSYGMNLVLAYSPFWTPGEPKLNPLYIKGKANVPVFLDCAAPGSRPHDTDRPPPHQRAFGISSMARFCLDRHDAHINGLFLDWSVRKVGIKQLWTLRWSGHFKAANAWTKAGGVGRSDSPEWMRKFKDY